MIETSGRDNPKYQVTDQLLITTKNLASLNLLEQMSSPPKANYKQMEKWNHLRIKLGNIENILIELNIHLMNEDEIKFEEGLNDLQFLYLDAYHKFEVHPKAKWMKMLKEITTMAKNQENLINNALQDNINRLCK